MNEKALEFQLYFNTMPLLNLSDFLIIQLLT